MTDHKGWISVKDRLPEEGEMNRVILFAKRRYPFTSEVLWGYYELKKWHTQWGRCDRITHWMPLPEPPDGIMKKLDRTEAGSMHTVWIIRVDWQQKT